jgi:hypothetical protein
MIKVKICKRKSKAKLKNIHKEAILDWILIACSPATTPEKGGLLMVYIRIKLHMDLQADKSLVVVKGPFFSEW